MLNISKDEKRYSEIELDLHKKLAYEKGRASIIEEFEKIKADVINIADGRQSIKVKSVRNIIDKRVAELKGE